MIEKNEAAPPDETITAQGFFLVEVIRDTRDGPKVIQRITTPNTVVTGGKKLLLRQASGLSSKFFKFGRCGINSLAAAVGDTNVRTAITGTLKTITSITMSGQTLVLVWSYASGGGTKSAAFKELAILSQRTTPGGTALARAVLSPLAQKRTTDKLKITYSLRVA
jgi:hypothetical protein